MNLYGNKPGKFFNKKINEKMLIGRDYYENREEDKARPYYVEVFRYLINFAKRNGIKTLDDLDKCGIMEDFAMNFIGDYEIVVYNSKEDLQMFLDMQREYMDTFELTDLDYENALRLKVTLLFKLGRAEEGERIIVNELKKNPKWLWGYVELVDDFTSYHKDLEKAKYYYELGLKNAADDPDFDALKERADMLK